MRGGRSGRKVQPQRCEMPYQSNFTAIIAMRRSYCVFSSRLVSLQHASPPCLAPTSLCATSALTEHQWSASISTLRALSHLTIRLSNSTPQRRRTHWHCSLLSKRTRTPSYLSKKNQCSTHESMLSQLNRAARVTRLVACSRRASTRRASTTGASSQEWKAAGLGAQWAPPDTALTEIVFVQAGMGCDQHGAAGASKAATRACRQAIEFNALRRALIKLSRRVSATAHPTH